ncbi:MAG: S-ribosylhomocysteine lyase [Limnochordia bacterium]|jgi:S-ribosylhomocysteine lyase|nr:S-ribosylhomocysteine lyase [Limnochordia bacterium]
MNTIKVESFSLDHTTVNAPHVRQAELTKTPGGDVIAKYDLRFTQPNENIMPTGAVHALEHLLAGYLREEIPGIIDLSPMGCRTGFYLIRLGEASEVEVALALIRALKRILHAEAVPARNAIQCGNYRDISLFGAKEYAKEVLQGLEGKYA